MIFPTRLTSLTCLTSLLLAGCTRTIPSTTEWFTDRAHDAGLDFVHASGMSGKFLQTEIMPPGVALLDYDNDGDLDVLLVQSIGGSRLFRNDLPSTRSARSGQAMLHFTDVTAQSGITSNGYGMGAAVADV